MNKLMRIVAVAACGMLAACATVVNRGRVAPAPGGGTTARLRLDHVQGLQAIYADGTQLAIHDEATQQDHVSFCRTFNESAGSYARGWVTVDRDCMTWIIAPYVELQRGVPHQVRVVTARGEATETVQSRMHIQWFWLNGVLLAAAPVGWVVDLASGRMNYFGGFDVADAVDRANTVASRGTR